MAAITFDRFLKEARNKTVLGAALQTEQAIREQRLISADIRRRGVTSHGRFGRHMKHIACIHPFIVHQMRQVYGDDCFGDAEFIADTLRRNPELRIPA